MPRLTFAAALALLAGAAFAQHDHGAPAATQGPAARPTTKDWTRQPVLLPTTNRGGDRASAVLKPRGIEAATVTVYAPGGPEARPLGENDAQRRRGDVTRGAAAAGDQ